MKGSIEITPDMVMKIVAVLFFTVTITYDVMTFINFQSSYESRVEARTMVDVAEAVLADRCLIKERNMFDYSKLADQPCVNIPSGYEVSIMDSEGNMHLSAYIPEYTFGFNENELAAIYYPCSIYKSDNDIIGCNLIVWRST